MKRAILLTTALCLCLFQYPALAAPAKAESVTVPIVQIGVGDMSAEQTLGTVTFTDTDKGLQIVTKLRRLSPGEHGFHIHEFPNCGAKMEGGKMVAGMAAGGHYDPKKTGKHMGPGKGGHEGDLPALKVEANGTADQTMIVKGLKVKDIRKRSIMVHAGGDNYSDNPANGGGGARIACGVIP